MPRLAQVGPQRLMQEVKGLGFQHVDIAGEGHLASRHMGLLADIASGRLGALVSTHSAEMGPPDAVLRDLLNACAISGAVVISPTGIYNPRHMHDRQRLGLPSMLSHGDLRHISNQILSHIRQPAAAGLRPILPAGLHWNRHHQVDLDPDHQVRQTIKAVLDRFEHTRDAYDVLTWLERRRAQLPAPVYTEGQARMEWRRPNAQTVHQILTDPMYAGAFGLGPRSASPHGLIGNPDLLVRNHHPGYIHWDHFERNQKLLGEERPYRVIDLVADQSAQGFSMPSTPTPAQASGLVDALVEARRWAEEISRRYAQASSSNRFVKAELERQWNQALEQVQALSARLAAEQSTPMHQNGAITAPLTPLPSPVPHHGGHMTRWQPPGGPLMAPNGVPNHSDQRYKTSNPLRTLTPAPDMDDYDVVVVPDWVDPQALAQSLPPSTASQRRHEEHRAQQQVDALLNGGDGQLPPDSLAIGLNRAGVRSGARVNWTSNRVQRVRRFNRERDE